MADTARTILQDVFEKLKIYAPGVAIDAADAFRGLSETNQLLDEWSNDSLTCFANLEQSFPLVIDQQQYTIGSGGNINAVRPLDIMQGPGAAYLMDNNNMRYPIEVVNQDRWNQIPLLTIQSNLPDTLFYDPQYPLGIVKVFPIPTEQFTVYFDARLQLSRMATLDTAYSLPLGYMSAIKNNLVIRLWPFYKQGDPTKTMLDQASTSLASIKRTNMKQSVSVYDSAIVSKAKNSYNIYTDTPSRLGSN